jgi:hypothetical protein
MFTWHTPTAYSHIFPIHFHHQHHIHTHTTLMLNLKSLLRTFYLLQNTWVLENNRQWNLDFTLLKSIFSLILDTFYQSCQKIHKSTLNFPVFHQIPWLYIETGHKLTWHCHFKYHVYSNARWGLSLKSGAQIWEAVLNLRMKHWTALHQTE